MCYGGNLCKKKTKGREKHVIVWKELRNSVSNHGRSYWNYWRQKITKKPVGNDIREGKKTLPIILAIKKAKGKNKKTILRVFGNSKASKQQIRLTVNVIRSLGVEEEVRNMTLKYAQRAEKSLRTYTGTAKDEMISLLASVISRRM